MDNEQNYQQPEKKKSKIGIILLVIFVCIIPVIILVMIMLVSFGVLMFNNSTGVVETTTSQVDSMMVKVFNDRIETYLGDNQNRSSVIALVQSIKVNNLHDDNKVDISVSLKNGMTYTYNDGIDTSIFSTDSKYSISASKNGAGYYDKVIIVEK